MNPAGTAPRAPRWADAVPDFWAVIEGFDYALPHVRAIEPSRVAHLREAARDAAQIYDIAVEYLRTVADDDELLALGVPATALDVVRLPFPHATLLGRFDFVEADGPRVLEYNAETPFLVWESFTVNGVATTATGMADPNAGAEAQLIAALGRYGTALGDPVVAVAALNPYREDWFTAQWIEEAWRRAGFRARSVPVHELEIDERGYVADVHGRIDVLHRLYPLEHFAADRDGPLLFEATCAKRVTLVNPACALLAQNKAILERIWSWTETATGPFTAAQRDIVRQRFLPTYGERPSSGTWVRKPIFGREGDSVSIHGETVDVSASHTYDAQPAVWQRFVDIPTIEVERLDGSVLTGWPIETVFVVDGEPGPVSMRVGDRITSAWAHFQPLGLLAARATPAV